MALANLVAALNYNPNMTITGAGDLTTPQEVLPLLVNQAITFGTGLNQMDLFFHDQRTLGNGASETLDLTGGLTDNFGNVLTFARIKLLFISLAVTANGTTIDVGGNANAWASWTNVVTTLITVAEGGPFHLWNPTAAGYVVTAATGDQLDITNNDGANSAVYDIYIGGASV